MYVFGAIIVAEFLGHEDHIAQCGQSFALLILAEGSPLGAQPLDESVSNGLKVVRIIDDGDPTSKPQTV